MPCHLLRFPVACLATMAALQTLAQSGPTSMGAAVPPIPDVAGLSTRVAACTSLFDYANEKWLAEARIPADRPSWGAFYEILQRNEELLTQALEEVARNPAAISNPAIRKTVDYFISGMDTARIDALGLQPLAGEMQRIGVLNSRADLPRAFARLNRIGIAAPLSFGIRQDQKDATRYIIELHQAGLGLPDRDFYFLEDEKSRQWRDEYLRHVANVLVLMGTQPVAAQPMARRIFALEKQLAAASSTLADVRDAQKTFNPSSLEALAKSAPGFAWPAYFRAIGAPRPGKFNVAQPAYYTAVAKLVNSVALEDWKLYLRWQLVRTTSDKLAAPFEQENFRFYQQVLSGKQAQAPRVRRVMDVIGGNYGEQPFGQGLGQMFVERAFPPAAKARALALVGNVKLALRDRLIGLEWMGPETRQRALAKLDAMQIKMGYPDQWRDLSMVRIDRGAYLGNWLRINELEVARDIARLSQPVDRSEWLMGAHIVNAYYNPYMNEIVFPAGIMQPPFFSATAEDAANYGAIGMVIGHEITHGFDDFGRQFDAQGNLQDWWTSEDAARYLARTAEIEKQYNAYEVLDGLKLNGKLTLGENISDQGGLKLAYLAYQKAQAGKPAAKVDNFTAEQRFFLAFAQSWREISRPEHVRRLLTTDTHSPPRFRVQGSAANSPEFAQAFGCQPQDPALQSAGSRVTIW